MSVTVVTDSAASIPSELVSRLGIVVVPMSVIIGGTVYPDGQLSLDEVMGRIGEGVTTSGTNPGEFLEAIEAIDGDVVVLTISAQMSSTFEAARTAARLGGGQAHVIDTRTASGGQGLVVLAAAEAAARGEPVEAVVAEAERVIQRVRLVATVQNLDRLIASGRVPGIAALANRWLGMQPLFEFREGHARPLRPAFSRDAALDRMAATWRHTTVRGGRLHVAALHAEAEEEAKRLLKQVTTEYEPETSFVAPFNSVMVVHTGLGLVGLAWWWDEPAD
ncbi:MAG: DegV family protein [Acidimicrobiales bacterium]|nr:DegV family protein [Acidimicrobiales bacterium]